MEAEPKSRLPSIEEELPAMTEEPSVSFEEPTAEPVSRSMRRRPPPKAFFGTEGVA